jgi:hypothetical protein
MAAVASAAPLSEVVYSQDYESYALGTTGDWGYTRAWQQEPLVVTGGTTTGGDKALQWYDDNSQEKYSGPAFFGMNGSSAAPVVNVSFNMNLTTGYKTLIRVGGGGSSANLPQNTFAKGEFGEGQGPGDAGNGFWAQAYYDGSYHYDAALDNLDAADMWNNWWNMSFDFTIATNSYVMTVTQLTGPSAGSWGSTGTIYNWKEYCWDQSSLPGPGAIGNVDRLFIQEYLRGGIQQMTFDDLLVTIPEPATMCLLGLGGLALLRRKRS